MRFIFFALGVPMMILSFFQVQDALPYVQNASLLVNGHEIVLSENEQTDLQAQIEKLFENSHTLPALGVVFDNEFQEDVKNGVFVSLKFDGVFEINDLPFEELLFRVSPDAYGFNLFRSNHGVVQGRCIYVDLSGKTMEDFSNFVNSLQAVQNELSNAESGEEILSEDKEKENAGEENLEQNAAKTGKNAENLQKIEEKQNENKNEKSEEFENPQIQPPQFENPTV